MFPGRKTTGLVLGKFMPPHLGHKLLVDFASNYVDALTVIVGTLKAEPIPGHLRFQWMKELFPAVRVAHLTDENPQYPHEHPDFWQIWHDSIRKIIPAGPDFVFASEDYGRQLAAILGARFVPVNISRELVPVSGTKIRTEPLKHWDFLPPPVRPYFLKRVCVFGPESTGKSTLTSLLAKAFSTAYAGEYARIHLEGRDGVCEEHDMPLIAMGQRALEDAMAQQANRVLFCDTDLLATVIWSETLFGRCDQSIEAEAAKRQYDLYLLLDPEVPWVKDKVRYLPHGGKDFFKRCEARLKAMNRPYVIIKGSWAERFESAKIAVRQLLEAGSGGVELAA